MTAFLLGVGLLIAALAGGGVVRIARGPRLFDRVLAANLVTTNGLLLLLIAGVLFERLELFVDLALAFALIGFVVPLAAGRLVREEGS
jgi:multicomponent Na+:H+ antiporter subunit F